MATLTIELASVGAVGAFSVMPIFGQRCVNVSTRGAKCANGRGFTLLELLVVMVIIGLLVGYVAPRYFSQVGKAEIKAARAQIDALEKALGQYRLDTGHYPSTDQGLQALNVQPSGEPKWQGPYLMKAVPPDPWGRQYVYRIPGEHGDFDLFSYGRDGQVGGKGEDADVTNW